WAGGVRETAGGAPGGGRCGDHRHASPHRTSGRAMPLLAGTGGGIAMSARASSLSAAAAVFQRDLLLAARRPGEWLQLLGFFVLVCLLFPLALSPVPGRLRELAPAALWVSLLLASLLALEFLYREDARD